MSRFIPIVIVVGATIVGWQYPSPQFDSLLRQGAKTALQPADQFFRAGAFLANPPVLDGRVVYRCNAPATLRDGGPGITIAYRGEPVDCSKLRLKAPTQ